MRRSTPAVAAAALATLVAGTGALAFPASAADPAITKIPVKITVLVGPTGAEPCVVDADLYVPAGVTAASPAPAVLTTNGFGGSKKDQAGAAQAFGREGYVTLSYTGLGFPDSGCKISLDDPDYDGKAAKQLVDYLAGLKPDNDGRLLDMVAKDGAGDPKVGMIGGSYGGQVQFAAASLDPRIDALIPIITWNDLSYSLAPNNTSFVRGVTYATPGVHKKQWTSLFFGVGIADGIEGSRVDPARNVGCPNFVTQACLSKAHLETFGYPDQATLDFARHASVASYVSAVRAPTLLVQGQKDTLFNLQEAAATYSALQAQGTPVQMIWQSWGHSLGGKPAPGELDLSGSSSLRSTYLGGRFLDWFDRHVKDVVTAPTGPEFSYFRDWVGYSGIATPAYASSGAFPVGQTLRLFLSGEKDLVRSTEEVRPGSQSFASPPAGAPTSYSETSSQGAQDRDPFPPSDAPGTFGAWTSQPVADATVLVGSPRLDVALRSPTAAATQAGGPAGQLVLFAKLYDVAPDGSQTLHNRLVSPVRVADVTKPVTIELPAVVQRIPRGHRLRLVLATSDAAYAGNTTVQAVTVAANRGQPSVLRLPVVSGSGPQAAAVDRNRRGGATRGDDGSAPASRVGGGAGGAVSDATQESSPGGASVRGTGAGLAATGGDGESSGRLALVGLALLVGGLLVRLVARAR